MVTVFDVDWNPVRWFNNSAWCRFIAVQCETCPTTGRVHWQTYVYGNTALGMEGVKRHLGITACHLDARKGSHEQAVAYCTKTESRFPGCVPYVLGTPPDQGRRNDLEHLRDAAQTYGLLGCFDADFSAAIRFHRGLEKYLSLYGERRTSHAPQWCAYYYGPPGTGKTREVFSSVDDHDSIYLVPTSSSQPWFDGYRPGHHKVILIDDYRGQWSVPFFLQLLDRYPIMLPVKGSHVHMGVARIYVTSNLTIEECYPLVDQSTIAAMRRRFSEIVHFKQLNMRLVESLCMPGCQREHTEEKPVEPLVERLEPFVSVASLVVDVLAVVMALAPLLGALFLLHLL